jgi:hypothetical protein
MQKNPQLLIYGMAVVVGDPRIANTPAGSIGEMMLLNLYCKLASKAKTGNTPN